MFGPRQNRGYGGFKRSLSFLTGTTACGEHDGDTHGTKRLPWPRRRRVRAAAGVSERGAASTDLSGINGGLAAARKLTNRVQEVAVGSGARRGGRNWAAMSQRRRSGTAS